VDLAELVRSIADALQPTADAKRIDVVVDDDGAPGVVFGDRTRLQQVVSNLLSNAIKFTPEGGTVHVSLRRDDDAAELVVADTGPGIPADFLPFVFEPFRQEGGSSRPHGGLGLGLSIVRHLVEAHHGTVKAESRGEGQGAAFTVRLPAAGFHGEQHETTMAADRWNRD
jgi:signal transduction histidine kinase